MPDIKNLKNRKTGVFNDPKPAAAPAPTVPTTLTESKPVDNKQLQKAASGVIVPDFLKDSTLPDLVSGELSGYVGFCDKRSKNYARLVQAGIQDGQTYIAKDNNFTLAYPLSYFLCMGESFRTAMVGEAGEFKFITRDLVTPLRALADQTGNKFALEAQAHYCCLLIVDLNGELIPIKADFRGTKSGAAEGAVRAVQSASTPEWLRLSNAHQATAAFPHPFGRVYNIVTTKYSTFKASGNSGFVAKCQSNPSTVDQMARLLDALKDEEFLDQLNTAKDNLAKRIEYFDKLASGEQEANS